MDTDKPTSENRPISSLCVLKRKLKHSRRVHNQNSADTQPTPEQHSDQKERLADLAMKIRKTDKSSQRNEKSCKRSATTTKGKVAYLSVVK
ncbi:MAG: hypothetical protein JXR18_06000 [Neptuniibacter sp.]